MSLEKQSRKSQPFLKWAGGKRWLAAKGIPVPSSFARLVEPFVGSAAVFFALRPETALLADLNAELINLYRVVKSSPDELESLMQFHHKAHSAEHYYKTRAQDGGDELDRAARMLYLNRTCWNGLYRVNKRGKFNVPIGTKTIVIADGECFADYAKALEGVELKCQDFEITIDQCVAGDFLFVDPPYTVKHNMNGFIKYNEKIFSWEDQIRLAEALRRAASRGVSVLVTNADHESVVDLYSADFEYSSLRRHSVLAGSAAYRSGTSEAIFTLNM